MSDVQKGTCSKCKRIRAVKLQNPGSDYPTYLCGTCAAREERRINTKEMYGRGRRGY